MAPRYPGTPCPHRSSIIEDRYASPLPVCGSDACGCVEMRTFSHGVKQPCYSGYIRLSRAPPIPVPACDHGPTPTSAQRDPQRRNIRERAFQRGKQGNGLLVLITQPPHCTCSSLILEIGDGRFDKLFFPTHYRGYQSKRLFESGALTSWQYGDACKRRGECWIVTHCTRCSTSVSQRAFR